MVIKSVRRWCTNSSGAPRLRAISIAPSRGIPKNAAEMKNAMHNKSAPTTAHNKTWAGSATVRATAARAKRVEITANKTTPTEVASKMLGAKCQDRRTLDTARTRYAPNTNRVVAGAIFLPKSNNPPRVGLLASSALFIFHLVHPRKFQGNVSRQATGSSAEILGTELTSEKRALVGAEGRQTSELP